MRILHLSDLHATPSKEADQRLLVDALLADIRCLHEDTPFDLVAFTGDLTQAGKPDEFELADALLLQPLLAATGLAPEQLIIALGNHDVDRDRIDRIAEAGLRELLGCREAVNELLDDEEAVRRHTERLDAARRILEQRYATRPPAGLAHVGQFHVRTVEGRDVGLAALNSAWRATGSPAGGDKGHLLVGDRQSKRAVELTGTTAYNVALVHHPFDWLARFDEDDVRLHVERHFDLVLTGHTHAPDPEQVANRRGTTVFSRAGCLYEHRDHPNGYSVLDVAEDGTVAVSVRTWWPGRGVFDAATDVAEGGRLVFPAAPSALAPARREAGDAVGHNAVLGGLVELVQQGSVIGDHLARLEAREPGELLVAPRLLEVPYRLAIAVGERRPVASVDAVAALDSARCLVVDGGAESGVTGSLLWLLRKRYDVDNERLPAYVRFEDIGPGKDPVATAVREALSRFGHAFGRTDPLPPVVVAVDDVEAGDGRKLDRLLRHMADHPENLYVLGCHDEAVALLDRLARAGVEARPAFLGPFGRRELRALVERIALTRHPELADRVLGLFLRESLPRTPFMMAVFVTVLSADGDMRRDGVSEATALERYVRLVLDHPDPSAAGAHRLDARIHEHILGSLARRLTEEGRRRLSRLDTERFLGDYFAGLGWEGSPGQVVDALVHRRLLAEEGGSVGFRHEALHDLFAAKQLLEDEAFAKFVLEDPLEHEAVVRYAAALKRSDARLLRTVGDAARGALAPLREVVDIRAFERMGEQLHGWSEGLRLDDLTALVRYRPFDHDDWDRRVDRALDRMDASEAGEDADAVADADADAVADAVGTQEDGDAQGSDAEDGLLRALPVYEDAVHLLSGVLRHSELVDDVALKQRLLVEALEAWSCIGVAQAAHEDRTGQARELFDLFFDDMAPAERERVLRVFGVAVMAGVIVGSLGSSKIVGLLRRVLDDDGFMERTANALFATVLYCELRGAGWLGRLEELYRRHGWHPVVAQLVMGYSRWTYHHTSPAYADAAGLERVVVRAILDEYKLTGLRAGRAKSSLLQELRDGRRQALRRSRGKELEPFFSRDLDPLDD